MIDLNDIKLEEKSEEESKESKEPLTFTQLEGLQKTYAHYLLFKEDSPTLEAILNKLVPEKKDLFKKMFTVLNKKHVKAGLQQFGAIKNVGFSGFPPGKHVYMSTYIQNPFNTIDRELYENKFLIDAIHEAVIQYFPIDGAVKDPDEEDKTIVNTARNNLQKSLQGYRGSRSEYIEKPSENPANIGSMDLDTIKKTVDKLPNVLHMEAIAELHRRAFLMVNPDDRKQLMENAKISIPSSLTPVVVPDVITAYTAQKEGFDKNRKFKLVDVTSDGTCLSASILFVENFKGNVNNGDDITNALNYIRNNNNEQIMDFIQQFVEGMKINDITKISPENQLSYNAFIATTHPDKIDSNPTQKLVDEYNAFLDSYVNNKEWQTLEIIGLPVANLLKKQIIVVVKEKRINDQYLISSKFPSDDNNQFNDKIYLEYNGETHYQALLPMGEFETTTENKKTELTNMYSTSKGGSTKKVKTRKPRIFKKWKSRRRKM
jgi:hypothetical protein